MKSGEQLLDLITLIQERKPRQVIIGTVSTVDQQKETCTVQRDNAPELYDVRLNAAIDNLNNKVVVFPKTGSKVLCVLIENDPNEAAVIKYTEIDSVVVTIGQTHYDMNSDGHSISRGNENLRQVIDDFISEVQKIIVVQGTSPNIPALEAIKNRVNQILR